MTRKQILALTAALAIVATQANAQGGGTQMTVKPESRVTLAGSSNVHDWSCRTSDFSATIEVDSGFSTMDFTQMARPITRVSVSIPVKSLKCGKGKMDENMYKALQAEKFPEITYVLSSYDVNTDLVTADSFAAETRGEITVAGKTISVAIPITAKRLVGGSAIGEGTVKLRMTDFAIKPPTALLGTLRTKNEIEVSFRVLLDKSTVVALSRP